MHASSTHAETSSLKIAVVGPGAIGCTILAHLGHSPAHELVVCARSPFDRLEVETPAGTIIATPRVLTIPAQASAVDWVLVATKTYDVPGTIEWLAHLVGPHTRVAVLQNGVEHRARFSGLVKDTQLVPVVIDCPAERTAPGRVRQRGPAKQTVPDDDAGRDYAKLFSGTPVEMHLTSDWTSAAWRKLCINSPGAVSALLLSPAGISRADGAAEVMRGMIREVVAVGRAEGATLDDSIVEQVINSYRGAPADSLNSLHADRLARRPMEFDARNGVISRLGRLHSIPTPLNDMAASLLSAVDWSQKKDANAAPHSS